MERVCTQQSTDPQDPDRAPADLVRAYRASELISLQLDALDLLANPTSAQKFSPRKWVFYRTIDKVVRMYRVPAKTKRVKLRLSGQSMAWSLLDERTVHIIPSAFIDNAVKYSPGGETVDVNVADELRGNKPFVALTVRSTGPASTREEESAIFKERRRGNAARAFTQGTGVGLVLARIVADQHGAKLAVRQTQKDASHSEWEFTCYMPSL